MGQRGLAAVKAMELYSGSTLMAPVSRTFILSLAGTTELVLPVQSYRATHCMERHRRGAAGNNGTVFRVNTDGSDFTNLHWFTATPDHFVLTNADGIYPWGGLTLSGNALYGTAQYGGTWGSGAIFSVNTDGSGFTNLHSFSALSNSVEGGYDLPTNSDGSQPWAGLVFSGNTLYGTASEGGTGGYGTVFRLNTDGSDFTNLYNFTSASDEVEGGPTAALVLAGNTLFGTTGLGSEGHGMVFRVNTDRSGFTNLYNFTGGVDGAYPRAWSITGNTLYGIAGGGGSLGGGTVFRINTDGSGFTSLYSFPADPDNFANSDGSEPAGLVILGSVLYGTTGTGGSGGSGSVFALALGAPALGIAPAGNQVVISWPGWEGNFVLQTANDLSSGIWSNITNGIITDGTNYFFTSAVTSPNAYFHLLQQ
jgi:uncharacterized repeat protein (TIGR03803 family)